MNPCSEKSRLCRTAVLSYYNKVLWEKHIISRREYREMDHLIHSHSRPAGGAVS